MSLHRCHVHCKACGFETRYSRGDTYYCYRPLWRTIPAPWGRGWCGECKDIRVLQLGLSSFRLRAECAQIEADPGAPDDPYNDKQYKLKRNRRLLRMLAGRDTISICTRCGSDNVRQMQIPESSGELTQSLADQHPGCGGELVRTFECRENFNPRRVILRPVFEDTMPDEVNPGLRRILGSRRMEIALNWGIVGYFFCDLFSNSLYWLVHGLGSALITVSVILGILAISVAANRFRQNTDDKLPYLKLNAGDYQRWFFILFAAWTPLASNYVIGFWIMGAIAGGTCIALLGILCAELARGKEREVGLTLGAAVFIFTLLTQARGTFVCHYGVPIIGHFFEKPEYDAKYMVRVDGADSDFNETSESYVVVADIHVEGRTESEYAGDDRLGNPQEETVTYRDVWIQKLYLPDERPVSIKEQDEPLSLGEQVLVRDSHKRYWYVTLQNTPVQ